MICPSAENGENGISARDGYKPNYEAKICYVSMYVVHKIKFVAGYAVQTFHYL